MSFKRATMDFFGEQSSARLKTSVLVFNFCVAATAVVAVIYGVVMLYWRGAHYLISGYMDFAWNRPLPAFHWWNPDVFMWVAGISGAIIVGTSLYMIFRLRNPIDRIMDCLEAVEIEADLSVPHLQTYCNVVSEMAIAAGMPAPRVFLMPRERGINALAVGWSKENAAVAVTSGSLDMLTRDELQGVVAHEFSHIFNGDMGMNVRMTGVLYGIDAIGILGRRVVDALIASSRIGVRGSDNVVAFVCWIAFFLVLPLLFISYAGVFCGALIRAAVSRQREYLADASAVQFTRNPAGIGSALKKIGGLVFSSTLCAPRSAMASHFFFADSGRGSLASRLSFSTHPSLEKRVMKIDPTFSGEFEYVPSYYNTAMGKPGEIDWLKKVSEGQTAAVTASANTVDVSAELLRDPERVFARFAVPVFEKPMFLDQLFKGVPTEIFSTAADICGAQALVYAMLIGGADEVVATQLKHLAKNTDDETYAQTVKLVPLLRTVKEDARIPLLDKALATVAGARKETAQQFEKLASELMLADKHLNLFEYVTSCIIRKRIEHEFEKPRMATWSVEKLQTVAAEACAVLSCVARQGASSEEQAVAAYRKGVEILGLNPGGILPADACDLHVLDAALARIACARMFIRRHILAACLVCATADREVTNTELDLIRGIADVLNCSLPPLRTGPVRIR